jgi:hypothetical protein
MGWTRTLLLGDIGNRLDIGDVESDLQFLRQRLRENIIDDESQAEELERLRGENEEMKLVLATLIRLLATKGVIDEAEIRAVADGASSGPTA